MAKILLVIYSKKHDKFGKISLLENLEISYRNFVDKPYLISYL